MGPESTAMAGGTELFEEKNCGRCIYHSGGTSPTCRLPLPWWAEPYDRPRVYAVGGTDCPAFEASN